MHVVAPQPVHPRWWRRHWKWAIPGAALALALVIGGVAAAYFAMVSGSIKRTSIYRDSLAIVRQDLRIIAHLGAPIESAFIALGTVEINNASGTADFSFGISGPIGDGNISIIATMMDDAWTYQHLRVRIDATGDEFDLHPPHIDP